MDHDAHDIYHGGVLVNTPQPVLFDNHCWIGFNSTILKGSIIPENSVIAANSVITKADFEKNSVIAVLSVRKRDRRAGAIFCE